MTSARPFFTMGDPGPDGNLDNVVQFTQFDLTCENCGHRFSMPPIGVGVGGSVWGMSADCPRCGGNAAGDRDAKYTWAAKGGRVVVELSRASPEELASLRHAIRTVTKERPGATSNDVAQALEQTGSDAGRSLAQWIREEGGVLGLVAVLIAVLQLIQSMSSSDGLTPDQVTEIVKEAAEQAQQAEAPTGRNERCPCFSGLKFKQCHGVPDSVRRQRDAARQAAGHTDGPTTAPDTSTSIGPE